MLAPAWHADPFPGPEAVDPREAEALPPRSQPEALTDVEESRQLQGDLDAGSFRTLVECLPAGVIVYRDGTVVYANRHMADILGQAEPESLLGQSIVQIIRDVFLPEEQPLAEQRLKAAATGGVLPPVERKLRRPDGTIRTAELTTLTVVLEGQPAHATIVRDLTDTRRMEAQLLAAERLASLGRVSAGIAHELNNPLAYLLGNLELAIESLPVVIAATQELPLATRRVAGISEQLERLHTCLQEACDGAERVRSIMRDLRAFALPGDGRRVRLDVRRPLASAVKLAQHDLRGRARLLRDLAPTPEVLGDEGRLSQVFLNLLINAVEALPPARSKGGESGFELPRAETLPTVRLSTRTGPGGEAVIEVRDDGPGLSREELAQLFDPFFTTKLERSGIGLGLSICLDIVRAHDGTLDVDSEPGHGTIVRVTLPPAGPKLGAEPTPPRPTVARRGRVLVVDDEPQVGAILQQILVGEHDVEVVHRGREALERVRRGERYDALLCDLMMPEMSGMDLHRALVEEASDLVPRIVFVSAGAYTPVAAEFLDRVPNLRLEKPFSLGQVRSVVRSIVG